MEKRVIVKGVYRDVIESFALFAGCSRIGYNRWVIDAETTESVYCDYESLVICFIGLLMESLNDFFTTET